MAKAQQPKVESEVIAEGVVETPSVISEETPVKEKVSKPSKLEVLKSKMKIIDY